MSTEELLKPRYEVMSLWPESPVWLKVGYIYTEMERGLYYVNDATSVKHFVPSIYKYPAIFRKMHWSEKIATKDQPKYVKFGGAVVQVDEVDFQLGAMNHKTIGLLAINLTEPATLAEYTAYINR